MLNLKKTAIAVLALSSSAAFAGTMGPVCTPGNVTVPCESTAWDFGAQALYIQAVYDADFGYNSFSATNNGNTVRFGNHNQDWGWGFKIEGSYHFSTGNDFNVNWYHYSKTTDHRFNGFANAFGSVVPEDNYTLANKAAWDAVNLEFGQHVDFGEMKNVRLHGGAQFGRVKTDARIRSNTEGVTGAGNSERRFSGFGPRVGADMSYDWGNGLGMYANSAAAILVGTSKFSNTANLSTLTPTTVSVSGSKRALVPELEAKLGATYTYAMASGDLTADVGYMWQNYFNANHVSLPAVGSAETDFGVQGLYFGLKWPRS